MVKNILKQIENGDHINFGQAHDLMTRTDTRLLCEGADHLRKFFHGNLFDLCSIINARSGRCSEDCKFCAQSIHYQTNIDIYETISESEALIQAVDNDKHGVKRISLVTAGRSVSDGILDTFAQLYNRIEEKTDLIFCASMGFLTADKAAKLKSVGVTRYHCNLEACEEFFEQVCTTHSYREKLETIGIARDSGMDICSGGIIGMGESIEHRLQLAFELRDLQVLSIPINILTPIAATPFADLEPLTTDEVLRCIAIFRIINPHAVVRLAGGRNLLASRQYECFSSGANGSIVGNYLTTVGNSLDEDLKNISQLGFTF